MQVTFEQLQEKVIQWGIDRDLYHPKHGATPTSQLHKFFEEFGELNSAILKNDLTAIKDAIGDCQVCLIHRAKFLYIDLNIVPLDINKDYKVIKDIEEHLISICLEVYRNIDKAIYNLEVIAITFGFKPFECLEYAYNEIKDRKGKMINRTFVKDAN